MPPYYNVIFQFADVAKPHDFVAKLNVALVDGEFSYGGVPEGLWGVPHERATLQELTEWNQSLIDEDVHAGSVLKGRREYGQFYLRHPRYSHCRVILYNAHCMGVIVPERDIFEADFPVKIPFDAAHGKIGWSARAEQIDPLKRLAIAVWETGLVQAVQTGTESTFWPGLDELGAGYWPAVLPFAIVTRDDVDRFNLPPLTFRQIPIDERGVLLERFSLKRLTQYFRQGLQGSTK